MSLKSLIAAAVAAAVLASLPLAASAQEKAPPAEGGGSAGEGGQKAPAYPAPTASEEIRIKELLALIPMPAALAAEKRNLAKELTGIDPDEGKAKTNPPEDPEEKQIEDLRVRIEAIDAQIKAISANLHGLYRKKLDQAIKDSAAETELDKKKVELRTIEKFMRDLTDSEAAAITGIDPKDVQKIEETRRAAIEDRKRKMDAFNAKFGEFMKGRRQAMDELGKLGSKAVPLMCDALAASDFDSGAAIAEVLFSVRDDDRFHAPLLSWFGSQRFDDVLAAPPLISKVGMLKAPGTVAALASGLARASFQLKAAFMGALYRTSKTDKANADPAMAALLDFLAKADQANMEICINIVNMFLADADVPRQVKVKALQAFERISRAPESGKMVRNIAYGLGTSGMEEAVDPLVRLLRHRDQMAAIYAVQGLGNLGPLAARAARDVIDLATSGQDIRMQQSAILALGKIGSTEAVNPLIALVESENKAMRIAARDALRQILKVDFVFNAARWRSYWALEQRKRAEGSGR